MIPRHPTALIDARQEVTYVTLDGVEVTAGSFGEAVELVGVAAARLGRPVRTLIWRADGGVEECAVTSRGELVDPATPPGPTAGSPLPAESLVEPSPSSAASVSSTRSPVPLADRITVMVANPKGGTGKTPVSVVLAAALAAVRPKDVGLVETNPTGNVALRTGASGGVRNVQGLARWLAGQPRPPYPMELFAGAHWCPPGFYVLPAAPGCVEASGPAPTLAAPMTAGDLQRVLEALRLNLALVVLDTGNDPSSEVWQAAARAADALVVPVRWTPDAAGAARRMLDELVQLGYHGLVQRTVVVPTWGPRDRPSRRAVGEHVGWFAERGLRMVALPPDRHLADRGPIVWGRLAERTRRAASLVASELVGL